MSRRTVFIAAVSAALPAATACGIGGYLLGRIGAKDAAAEAARERAIQQRKQAISAWGEVAIAKARLTRAQETLEAAETLREEGDETRRKDRSRVQLLELLAKKLRLSPEEMAEAQGLIDELGSRYGPMPCKLDEQTGRLTKVQEARAQIGIAMRQRAIAELERERDALEQVQMETAKHRGLLGLTPKK